MSQFQNLERVVARYRHDVHRLPPGATAEALRALESHLGAPLPPGLRRFLLRHNGATLFRGALRLRATAEIAVASRDAARVVLFADRVAVGDAARATASWAYVQDPEQGWAFGPWDGAALDAVHRTFEAWFDAELAILDARVDDADDALALRLEVDPEDPWLLVRLGRRHLERGDAQRAAEVLEHATERAPRDVEAWQRLGDAWLASDRARARRGWMTAFRQATLPLPWPGAALLDAEVLRSLGGTFTEPEAWERELERFLEERVADVGTAPEFALVVAVARELARSLTARGRRSAARQVLADQVARLATFSWRTTPWDVLIELASLEIDLGNHDEAEAILRLTRADVADDARRVGARVPTDVRLRALIALARIAVIRQEPWAEDILDEAEALIRGGDAAATADAERVRLYVFRAERASRLGRTDVAGAAVEEASRTVRRIAARELHALVGLAVGEVDRLRGEAQPAAEAWRRALHQLGETGDPETRYRLRLRLGDIALDAGDFEHARAAYSEAAGGFAAYELPVREAWALVRLARVTDGAQAHALLDAARRRFMAADLAAGVAAADAFAGDASGSLTWHLERATEHARARHNAQRGRAPWTRADADRPERRLGAHRLAIAASPQIVADELARELGAASRAIATGRGRPLDPPVLRYVAAADLLAAHPSFEAARVLLSHLLSTGVDGAARRALVGAVARSSNAALVDGLLSTVESPTAYPAPSVAAAAEVLGLRREAAASAALAALAAPGRHPMMRRASIIALGRLGLRERADAIRPALEDPHLDEPAALALLMLGDRMGVEFHSRALTEDRHDLSGHPGEIVGRYGGPSHLLVLLSAARGHGERALGALQGLGLLGDPRAVPTLLEALGSRDTRVNEVAAGSLEILLGHREEPDGSARQRWVQWWEGARERFVDGQRYREGKLFDAGLLLTRMEHADAWVRRTAYDELVITTGQQLPFDADGPWRVQQAHLRAWRRWWSATRSKGAAGRWFLDGRPLL